MKTTVEISDPLFEEAKRETEKSGVTLRDLIELGLRRELEQRKAVKPFKLRDASVAGAPAPGIREDRMRWYAYMGTPGYPDTVDGINEMLDRQEREEKRR